LALLSEVTLPFRQFVLKVHSRCDLACDHCYVYEHADQSWRRRPLVISPETAAMAAERIAEHARAHGLAEVHVILHGGEPLLAGAARLAEIISCLRRVIEPACRLELRIHTNGIRLGTELCELFRAERVKVGISLDGDRHANDLHRRYADGRSSHDRVLAAIGLLRQERYREIYAGLLATIDVRSDPVTAYRALAALDPPNLDFLLPHGTWDNPPSGAGVPGAARYADWLIAVYTEWNRGGRPVPIRMFESIIATSHGGASITESLGLEPSDVAVIETDGEIEQADSIKVAYHGAPGTGLRVAANSLDEAAAHPAIRARQLGVAGLAEACRQCAVVSSCGGGLYAHRYKAANGFDNPSVYCADLKKIITHVQADEAARRRPTHSLPWAQFDALAAGFGDAEAIAYLSMAQRSLRRALLRLLRRRVPAEAGLFSAGWDLLTRLDRSAPAAVERVLSHPYVRAWAERCLRAGDAGPAHAGHLASVAAAAAIGAGALTELEVPVAGGYVSVPSLGRLRVGDTASATLAVEGVGAFEVRTASGTWRVEPASGGPDPDWEPVRELRAGGFAVRLEDTDPYRDCHQWPVTPRLTTAEAAAWQARFEEAWRLIEDSFPQYAPAIASGLSVLLPLANDVPGREISAAAREAFGAVAIALPASGADLALLIIHEFQHVKLGALFDLFDLCDRTDQRVFYAPWREDPRPLGPLLQGTYAHIGVTDYWRLMRHVVTGPDALAADEQFARWQMMTLEAIETLEDSGGLTRLGVRFVAGMRATVQPWADEPVAEAAKTAARDWAVARQSAWRGRQVADRS
jgi:uncharacterized protein